jgi:glycosyltransferase involved in cell wall biosynthesis
MNPLPISVSIISGAEERRIGRTLESVSGWVTEIVVVLNEEVKDATEEIALKSGAKVFREPWKGHVRQKNSALEKCAQPWVLCLDTDEVVSPALKEEIVSLIQGIAPNAPHNGYDFPRCSFYCGRWIRHGDWYPDRKVRLIRRGKARWGGEDPHDALHVDGTVGRLHGDLLHLTMETINHQVAKTVKYADLFAENSAQKKRSATFFDLAFRPVWRFMRGYVFKLGFLDGWQGFAIAWMTAFYTFLRYLRVRENETSKLPPT